jgi:hypothetical protein
VEGRVLEEKFLNVLVSKLEEGNHFIDLEVYWRKILKWALRE